MLTLCSCFMALLSVLHETSAVGYCNPRVIRIFNQERPVPLRSLVGFVYFDAMTEKDVKNFNRAVLYIAPDKEDMAGANLTTYKPGTQIHPTVTPIWFIKMDDRLIKGNNYPGDFNVIYDYRTIRCSGEAMLTFICNPELAEGHPTFTITTKEARSIPQYDIDVCEALARSADSAVQFTSLKRSN